MIELTCNLHIHSKYSDGSGNFRQIALAAADVGVDIIITTDHNVLVKGVERYYHTAKHTLLHLTGEEVHDQNLQPQHNHALVIGCPEEVSPFASDPQELINKVIKAKGLIFLAHPYEKSLPLFNEEAITWENWDVNNFTGIELWNGFSEFKTVVNTLPQALFYAFLPWLIPHQPLPDMLEKWSALLDTGKRITAVTGSDAHALLFSKGIFKKVIFPYAYHFLSLNNHLLVPDQLSGDLETDKRMIYHALANGSSFIGHDRLSPTKGFSFTAQDENTRVQQGGTLSLSSHAMLKTSVPAPSEVLVYRNRDCIYRSMGTENIALTVTEEGAYRVEVYRSYIGKRRGWIYSNPIYIRKT